MKKFIVLYRAPKSFMEGMENVTPEEMKKGMEPWMAWADKCGTGLVEMGTPLGNAHTMSKDHHGLSESDVSGYSILQAESWDELGKMLEGHPHLDWCDGCEIDVHESMPMGM